MVTYFPLILARKKVVLKTTTSCHGGWARNFCRHRRHFTNFLVASETSRRRSRRNHQTSAAFSTAGRWWYFL